MKNVGKTNQDFEFNVVTTKIDTNVKVINRETFIKRISEIEQDASLMTSDIIKCVLQHLYFRYILNVGDSGTHNLLLREDNNEALIIGIDLEEQNTSKKEGDLISMLFKKPSKHRIKLYSSYLHQIKHFQELSKELQEGLTALGIDTVSVDKKIKNWIVHAIKNN